MKKTGQPQLRVIDGGMHNSRCNASNLSAAAPRGSDVWPCSISLTADGDNPMRTPISANVNPGPRFLSRKSATLDAHVVMSPILRPAVDNSQRSTVTGFRENKGMPKPPGMPSDLHTIGARVRWWREYRGIARGEFAKKVGIKYSTLSDLELGRSNRSESLHLIAAALRLNAHYLETGKGEPESGFAQEPPPEPAHWPFEAVPLSRLEKLNLIERKYAETRLQEALAEIDAERRKAKRAG